MFNNEKFCLSWEIWRWFLFNGGVEGYRKLVFIKMQGTLFWLLRSWVKNTNMLLLKFHKHLPNMDAAFSNYASTTHLVFFSPTEFASSKMFAVCTEKSIKWYLCGMRSQLLVRSSLLFLHCLQLEFPPSFIWWPFKFVAKFRFPRNSWGTPSVTTSKTTVTVYSPPKCNIV